MFRFSNKVVQLIFQDKTQIILNSNSQTFVYVNKQGEEAHHRIDDALEGDNDEMKRRLRYMKEMLTAEVD
jgi:hypothetical protein